MSFFRAALFVVFTAVSVSPAFADDVETTISGAESWRRLVPEQYPAYVPLSEIAIYQLEIAKSASSDFAMAGLRVEVERLSNYSKSLEIGAERRALFSKVFGFESRLYSLTRTFDAEAWQTLRADLRAEWLSIQAGLKPPAGVVTVADASAKPASGS